MKEEETDSSFGEDSSSRNDQMDKVILVRDLKSLKNSPNLNRLPL